MQIKTNAGEDAKEDRLSREEDIRSRGPRTIYPELVQNNLQRRTISLMFSFERTT